MYEKSELCGMLMLCIFFFEELKMLGSLFEIVKILKN